MKYATRIYENSQELFDAWSKLNLDNKLSITPLMNFLYRKSKATGCYLVFEVKNKKHAKDLDKIKEYLDFRSNKCRT